MDYGGVDKRKTKGDLKKKRLNRGYKRGGQFRTMNVDEVSSVSDEESKSSSKKSKKKKGKSKQKRY